MRRATTVVVCAITAILMTPVMAFAESTYPPPTRTAPPPPPPTSTAFTGSNVAFPIAAVFVLVTVALIVAAVLFLTSRDPK